MRTSTPDPAPPTSVSMWPSCTTPSSSPSSSTSTSSSTKRSQQRPQVETSIAIAIAIAIAITIAIAIAIANAIAIATAIVGIEPLLCPHQRIFKLVLADCRLAAPCCEASCVADQTGQLGAREIRSPRGKVFDVDVVGCADFGQVHLQNGHTPTVVAQAHVDVCVEPA